MGMVRGQVQPNQHAPCVARCVLERPQSRRPVVVLPLQLHSRLSLLLRRLSVCFGGWFRWVRLASLPYGLFSLPPAFTPESVSASNGNSQGLFAANLRTKVWQKYLWIQNNPQKWYARQDLNLQPLVPELGIYTSYYSDSVEKWGDYAPPIHASEAIMCIIDTLSGPEMGQN